MSNVLSGLTLQDPDDIATLMLVGADTNKTPIDRKISASQMLAAYIAANVASDGGGMYNSNVQGISIPVGNYADSILYTPKSANNDVVMVTLEFGQATIVPQLFYFQVYIGNPANSGVLIYDSQLATGAVFNTAAAYATSPLYATAAGGNNVLYTRIYNVGQANLVISFQGTFFEFLGNGVSLPTYMQPPPYLGALMQTVHVGPNEQFTEPLYGLQALAPGGTMILDDGHYYFPIAFQNVSGGNITTKSYNFGGQQYNVFGGTSANPSNRFIGGETIKSASNNPYNCIMDGLGGVLNGTTQNGGYRLAEGKGLIYTNVPITVKGIQLINAGGADVNSGYTSDGEAAIYAEAFLSPGTLTIINCGFDNNENGLFVPDLDTYAGGGTFTQGGGPGANVSAYLQHCDFGFNAGNGADGYSHNFYYEGPSMTVDTCHMYSTRVGGGNTMKNRGPLINVINSYVEAGQGRALDSPEGGSVTISNTIINVAPSATQNMFDYNGETTQRSWRTMSNPLIQNCTIIGTRNPNSTIWYNLPSGYYNFTSCTQQWYSYSGSQPGFIPQRVQSGFQADDSACQGLFLNPTQGGTTLTTSPVRAASIAQPGATPTGFSAFNGNVTFTY